MNVGYSIMSSIDFKINIKSYLINDNTFRNTINFVNTKSNYYFHYLDSSGGYKTIFQRFLDCSTDKLVIQNSNEVSHNFYETGIQNILFSVNKNLRLSFKGEVIGQTSNYFISLENEDFIFQREDNEGVFSNYYAFGNKGDSDICAKFSLICPLKIVVCPSSCESCDSNKDITSKQQFCVSCSSNYYKKQEEKETERSSNCYSNNDEEIKYYYLDTVSKTFKKCDPSCNSCNNGNSCSSCKDGFYFTADENNNIIYTDICYSFSSPPPKSYLDHVNMIDGSSQTVFKTCYETCKTCNEYGSPSDNKCLSCNDGKKYYEFNPYQCTEDSDKCIEDHKYWQFKEDNNIECTSSCEDYIVLFGENRGQCVKSCQDFMNPFEIIQTSDLYSINCGGQKYCINYDICTNGYFDINNEAKTCTKMGECEVDFFEGYDNFDVPPPTEAIKTEEITIDEKKNDIEKRLKIIKILSNKKEFIINVNYHVPLILEYFTLLKSEMIKAGTSNMYLITSTSYSNFTITIYPLDIEDFSYEKVFIPNNLGFGNFTKLYPDFLNYEIISYRIILIGILEYHAKNSSINDLNYFVYSFNEKTNDTHNSGHLLDIDFLIGQNNINELELQFPLHNYININSSINKRNTENLVDNIKGFYEKYPEVELSNISDPFYNDICTIFTTDVGTDMTLNDRRHEYYTNLSLCEGNCSIIKVINKNSNPRSLCSCDLKYKILFDDERGRFDNVSNYSVPNSRSFVCISESFNSSISKNGNFWIFIIIIILQIYFVIIYLKHRQKILNEMLGIHDKNNETKIDLLISSSEDSKMSYIIKKKNMAKKRNQLDSDSKNEEIVSAPVNVSAPPKKKDNDNSKKRINISTKTDKLEDKDLISGNDSTIIRDTVIKLNEKKPHDYSDISFDDLYNEYEPIKIDNLFERNHMMLKDNYLKNPINMERERKFKKIKKALKPLKKEGFKYCQTCEDILYLNENKNKFTNKKNKDVIKILGGQDLFSKPLIENYSDNDNKPRYPKTKVRHDLISEEDRGILSDDQFLFHRGPLKANRNFLIDENNVINKVKVANNINNNIDDLLNTGNKNTLSKSLVKKEIKKNKEDEKNNSDNDNEQRLKTEIDMDAKNKIKTELLRISKRGFRPKSSYGIFGKYKKKINSSALENNYNTLIKSNKTRGLKSKPKSDVIKNKKEISKESESKRVMIGFQEEGDLRGDNALPSNPSNEEEYKMEQRRTRNLKLLNQKYFYTTITELIQTQNEEIKVEENLFLYFWKYFMKRELFIMTIVHETKNIPYFIRYSCLIFCISFIFLLNCFFFFESNVHKRYINALTGKKNRLGYYFKKEFPTTLCVALLSNLFKMIIIKMVLIKVFKIGELARDLMKVSSEKGLTQKEVELLHFKRKKYVDDYHRNLMIYFICLICLNVFIAYICICYAGVFRNSIGAFLYAYLFCLIFAFIFCAIICFLIVCLYRIGKILKSKCIVSAYIVLSTLY